MKCEKDILVSSWRMSKFLTATYCRLKMTNTPLVLCVTVFSKKFQMWYISPQWASANNKTIFNNIYEHCSSTFILSRKVKFKIWEISIFWVLRKSTLGSSSQKIKMKVWNLSKGGGGGQNPNPNFFGIHFGSIEIKIWGRFRAIDTFNCF